MSVNGIDTSASPPDTQRQSSQNLEHVDLYVKAGQDGSCLGGCPFCQRVFMTLILKHEAGALTFTAHTIDLAHPAKDWKLGNQLPVFVHKDETLTEVEEMISYIDKTFPEPPMLPELPKANEACVNVFSKFNFYVKNPGGKGPEGMLIELRKLDGYLRQSGHKFLCGDEMTHLDCIMLPKLQHIRVVAKAFKDLELPVELKSVWGYLGRCYEESAFTVSSPSDQEIVYHWQGRAGLPPLSKEATAHYRTTTTPRYSHDIPEELRPAPPPPAEEEVKQNDVQAEAPQRPISPTTPTTPITPSVAETDFPVEQKQEGRNSQISEDEAPIYENIDEFPARNTFDTTDDAGPEVPEKTFEAQSAPEVESSAPPISLADDDKEDRKEDLESKLDDKQDDVKEPEPEAAQPPDTTTTNADDDAPIYGEVIKNKATTDADDDNNDNNDDKQSSTPQTTEPTATDNIYSDIDNPEPKYAAEPFPVS